MTKRQRQNESLLSDNEDSEIYFEPRNSEIKKLLSFDEIFPTKNTAITSNTQPKLLPSPPPTPEYYDQIERDSSSPLDMEWQKYKETLILLRNAIAQRDKLHEELTTANEDRHVLQLENHQLKTQRVEMIKGAKEMASKVEMNGIKMVVTLKHVNEFINKHAS